jgi:hypothetical protein
MKIDQTKLTSQTHDKLQADINLAKIAAGQLVDCEKCKCK